MPTPEGWATNQEWAVQRFLGDPRLNAQRGQLTPLEDQMARAYVAALYRGRGPGKAPWQLTGPENANNPYAISSSEEYELAQKAIAAAQAASPRNNETYEQWVARATQMDPELGKVIASHPDSRGLFEQYSGSTPERRQAADMKRQLNDFAQEMMKPFNPNDPETQRMLINVASRIATRDRGQGISGGMSAANQQRGVADALLGEQARRKEMAMRGMQLALGQTNRDEDVLGAAEERAADVRYQNELMGYEGKRRDLGMIGGALGAWGMSSAGSLAGSVSGMAGGGVPGGIAGGISGGVGGLASGWALGEGIGKGMAGNAPVRKPRRTAGMTGMGY